MGEPGAGYVLLVDDLPEQREIYREILRYAGMLVLEAPDGETAVHLARAHVPDVVLLDVRLPDIDGFEVMRRLRAEPRTRWIPVLLLTATAVPEGRGGFAELLIKPVPPRDALAAVRRHLRGDARPGARAAAGSFVPSAGVRRSRFEREPAGRPVSPRPPSRDG